MNKINFLQTSADETRVTRKRERVAGGLDSHSPEDPTCPRPRPRPLI